MVYPAAGFAPMLATKGVPVAEFNMEETPCTGVFRYLDSPHIRKHPILEACKQALLSGFCARFSHWLQVQRLSLTTKMQSQKNLGQNSAGSFFVLQMGAITNDVLQKIGKTLNKVNPPHKTKVNQQ